MSTTAVKTKNQQNNGQKEQQKLSNYTYSDVINALRYVKKGDQDNLFEQMDMKDFLLLVNDAGLQQKREADAAMAYIKAYGQYRTFTTAKKVRNLLDNSSNGITVERFTTDEKKRLLTEMLEQDSNVAKECFDILRPDFEKMVEEERKKQNVDDKHNHMMLSMLSHPFYPNNFGSLLSY